MSGYRQKRRDNDHRLQRTHQIHPIPPRDTNARGNQPTRTGSKEKGPRREITLTSPPFIFLYSPTPQRGLYNRTIIIVMVRNVETNNDDAQIYHGEKDADCSIPHFSPNADSSPSPQTSGQSSKLCSFDGCFKKVFCRDMCRPHYRRFMKENEDRVCKFDGCSKKIYNNDYCRTHNSLYRKGLLGPCNNPYPNKVECEICGQTYYMPNGDYKRNEHFFCSQTCYYIHHYGPTSIRHCEWCGSPKEFYDCTLKREGSGRFCSKECKNEWQSVAYAGESNWLWKGGHPHYYGPNWFRQRRKARKRDNCTCQECSKTEDGLDRKHHTHHKIPFRVFGLKRYAEANLLSNLVILCDSCHKKREKEYRDKERKEKNGS